MPLRGNPKLSAVGCTIALNPFLTTLIIATLLTGYATANQHSAAPEPPAIYYVGKQCPVSRVDISAAVIAAEHSEYFLGKKFGPFHHAQIINLDQVWVMYGEDIGGYFVLVERVHGRWTAIAQSGWNS